MSDLFHEYRELDVSIRAAGYSDIASIDVNGTELILKQGPVPVIVEIYIEEEEDPIGAINIARGETVSLGGVNERIADTVSEHADVLRETADELDELADRSNPPRTRSDE